jgi:hypothetical protein
VNYDRHNYKAAPQKRFQYKNGKIFFSREMERKFYFILTILMLLVGLLAKVGLF